MSDDANNSVIDKITELYQQFQKTLSHISHQHLESCGTVIQKIDEAHQEELRKKIQAK